MGSKGNVLLGLADRSRNFDSVLLYFWRMTSLEETADDLEDDSGQGRWSQQHRAKMTCGKSSRGSETSEGKSGPAPNKSPQEATGAISQPTVTKSKNKGTTGFSPWSKLTQAFKGLTHHEKHWYRLKIIQQTAVVDSRAILCT